MSSGPVRRVSPRDIQLGFNVQFKEKKWKQTQGCNIRILWRLGLFLVQSLIERCLQLYMNQKEVVETLLAQAKIEPGFTELVWQKLEKENWDFFRAYYLRLMVKHQIIEFNKLLEQQVLLMHQIQPTGVASMPTSNGSHIQQLHHNSALYATEQAGPALKQENVQHNIGSRSPNAFTNGGSSSHKNMHSAIDMSAHACRIDVPHNLLPTQSSNIDLIQDSGSFGYLDQIPRSFSFSDLTADFSQSADILESYSRSPFLTADTENFLDSHDGEHQGDNKRLDAISEGLSYEDFGSE
ncbi:uncharacterized protein LOC120013594 isoform X5 [Tripterygium wilfordii]|uniref:uncharacterized protein LOC120013594 isoform X5 n=1 Tax=Tripterygium wilfordii TaxID=458696 RepID=UPI0018F7F4ED|nr:uncharacterized protein LOC120013594 isoform X5 [Tripterygium wilfordii]